MVFGKEAGGLSQATREKALKYGTHKILNTYIPTIPELDSLNVAMAATVLIYEMVGVVLLLWRDLVLQSTFCVSFDNSVLIKCTIKLC